VPVADDIVVFDGRAATGPDDGMLDSESGDAAQCTYDLLHIKSTFAGDIGSATEPLCCSPDRVIMEGSGTLHLLCGKTDQNTSTTIPLVIINNPSATVYLYSNCNDATATCEYTDVYVIAGTVTLAYYNQDTENCGCYVGNLHISPRNDRSSNATVTIEKDAYKVDGTVATNIYMNNGTLTTNSMAGTIELRAGTVNFGADLGANPETDLNITELRMHGGTFNWYPDDSGDDAYIGKLWLFGGTLDASGTTNADRAKVLGNGDGNDIYLFTGATLNIANGRGNITIAAGSKLWNYGGLLLTDDNAQIAVSYDQA